MKIMVKLLKKELALVVKPSTFIFTFLAALLVTPNYPKLVGMLYFIFGIQITFQYMFLNKDAKFTAMLPVSRNDIVKSKCITVGFIELLQIVAAIPFALISVFLVSPNGNDVGMDANFAFFGEVLFLYAIYNFVFLTKFYKTGYRLGAPILYAIIAFFVSAIVVEVAIACVPFLKGTLDSVDPNTIIYQLMFLAIGIVVYVLGMVATYKISCKNFKKVTIE